MAKKSDPKTWIKRINASEKMRDNEKNEKGWDSFLDEYQGKYNIVGQSNVPAINMVYGHVHTLIPRLYFRDPFIQVNAKGQEYIQRARILSAVINYLFAELNVKREIEKLLIDVLLIGHGWFKFGYAGSFGKIETAEDRKGKDAKRKKDDSPVESVNEFVKNEEIFVVHVPWNDIVFDPLSKDPPYDCRWIAHSFIKPLDAVKESALYENTAKLESNVSMSEDRSKNGETNAGLKANDVPLVKLWEVWDKDSGMIYTVAEGHDEFLRKVPNIYEMEGLPFSMLKFNRVPGKPYPLSDIFLIEPQILERIKIRATQINHIKRWNRQAYIEKGSMEEAEVQKWEQAIDGALIQVNPGKKGPQPIDYAQIQAEIFQLDNLIQQDLDAVIGVTDTDRGGRARTQTRTLGELNAQSEGTASRAAKRQDMLEDFLEEVCKKIIQLLKQFQDVEKYVRITGKDATQVAKGLMGPNFDGTGVKFTKDDIQGEYDVDVKAGSTLPMDKQNRIKVLEAILQMGPNIGMSPGGPVSLAVGREILRDLEIVEIEQAFEQEEALMQRMQGLKEQQMQAASMVKPDAVAPPPPGIGGPPAPTSGAPLAMNPQMMPPGMLGT